MNPSIPSHRRSTIGRMLLAALLLLSLPVLTEAQWSAQPGERVRNAFGPEGRTGVTACRGACGLDCPSSCKSSTAFECDGTGALRRVNVVACGTHQGCREHDDCLDRCAQQRAQGFDCATVCHSEAVERYGLERAGMWAGGGGPYDGEIVFEYTRNAPGAPEALYRCGDGSELVCTAGAGECMANGAPVAPVFEGYAPAGAGAMRIADFRSGRVCREGGEPSAVCETSSDIRIVGDEDCATADGMAPCTWYGFEFDYAGADPNHPLLCSSAGGEEDFLGGIVSDVIRAVPAQPGTELGDLLGHFQKELQRGGSLADVLSGISITPHGGTTVGGAPPDPVQQPGVPREVELAAPSGRLLVPMFEIIDGSAREPVVVREVRCTHRDLPVLETTFRLHF